MAKTGKQHSSVWDELFKLFPGGYDIWATAGPGHYFDAEAAERGVEFYELFLTHVKGELAGQAFKLEPWQKAIVGATYGWKRPDGSRRFREVFIYVPRKNGKSTFATGFALGGLILDGEEGAEVYSLAADRDQARLVFEQARAMVEKDPVLSGMLKTYRSSIAHLPSNSSYKPLSSEAKSKHGGNTHVAIIDELHAQPNAELVEVIQTSVGARRQPLIIYITTADYSRPSICNETLDLAEKVRDGIIDKPDFLPVIYAASLDDDWTSPEVWRKANPNLGISISEEYIRGQCEKAKAMPSYENTFKRLHLNIQTEQDIRWLVMADWNTCPTQAPTEEQLRTSPCCGGVDLSSTTDLTAFALYWPEFHYVKLTVWIPEAKLKEIRNQRIYSNWVSQGHICTTPGSAVDYEWVKAAVKDACTTYRVRDIGCDPWNASHFMQQLTEEEGLPMISFGQGFASMNEPSKHLERLVVEHKLNHGGNPVLKWMASNACAKTDPAGNIKPDKERSSQKIDGLVATIIAIGRSMFAKDTRSVYESRGIVTL